MDEEWAHMDPGSNFGIDGKSCWGGHCWERDCRSFESTIHFFGKTYWWFNMEQYIKELKQSCIHCIVSRTHERIPRPLAIYLHINTPNELFHADILYVGDPDDYSINFLFVIKDDLSASTWMHPWENADRDTATSALTTWLSSFDCMDSLLTDQGMHFVTSLMSNLTKSDHVRHHFTMAYSPWAHGKVRRLCKELIRMSKALLSEWKLLALQWPSIVVAIHTVLINALI